MKTLLKIVTRVMEVMGRRWEARLGTVHQVPGDIDEFLDKPFNGAGGAPLQVDIFRPKGQTGPLPVAVVLHGGGLVVGTRKLSKRFSENLAMKGYLVFTPEYRLAKETDAISEIGDVYESLSYVSEHLSEYGGDRNRVAVISESAGSFLGVYAVASLNSQVLRDTFGFGTSDLKVSALVCFSGMFYTLRRDAIGIAYAPSIYGDRRKDPSFRQLMDPGCPEVMNNLPPVFLTSSDADFLKRYTTDYCAALRKAGHLCELLYYKDNKELTHAFPPLKTDLPESREVMEKMVAWIGQIESRNQLRFSSSTDSMKEFLGSGDITQELSVEKNVN